MSNFKRQEAARSSTEAHAGRDLVRVYNELAGQNRWVGMAYDATSGGVLATASSGTLAATRDALTRASRHLNAPPPQQNRRTRP